MKRKIGYVVVLGIAAMTTAIASQAGSRRLDLLGDAAPETAAQRTIVITPNTRFVKVEGGEIVKFIVGSRTFTWNFNGPTTTEVVDLNRIAPSDMLNNKVTVYVAPNPLYARP